MQNRHWAKTEPNAQMQSNEIAVAFESGKKKNMTLKVQTLLKCGASVASSLSKLMTQTKSL